jgi:hypothetical protein
MSLFEQPPRCCSFEVRVKHKPHCSIGEVSTRDLCSPEDYHKPQCTGLYVTVCLHDLDTLESEYKPSRNSTCPHVGTR